MRALLLLAAAPLLAHDFWIEPATFSPHPGEIVAVRLRVGQDLFGDPVARDPHLVNQFVVANAAGRKPLVGRDGADPAGLFRAESPDVIGYFSNPSAVELAAEKFSQYLKDEGLDRIASPRGPRVRELYSRCAKALLRSGHDRVLGFPLELIAEANPYAAENLPVRLTWHDRPLAGALVVAMNTRNPAEKQSARTDAHGRVRLRLHPGGMWMIKAVHIVPAPSAAAADWSSYWASLTFGERP